MRVLISGAGIAGLSLALRLDQRGLMPVLVERSPTVRAGGYMLGLVDPGYDAAARMSIIEDLRKVRYAPQQLVYIDPDGTESFRLERRALASLAGARQLSLMRGDIERVLYAKVRDRAEFHFDRSIAAVEATPAGVVATLNDGTTLEADLVVGADGLHSRIRSLCFGPEEQFVRFLGARVAAFVLNRDDFPDIGPGETYSMTEVGRGSAIASVGDGRLVAFFVFRARPAHKFDHVDAELRYAFCDARWHVGRLLAGLSKATSVYFDDVAQVICPRWSSGRVVLLGDAGSAVSLIAGGGASLAMAGAYILAEALADTPQDIAGALARYEKRMRPLVDKGQKMARRNAALFLPNSRFHLALRNAALRVASSPRVAGIAGRLLSRHGDRL